MLSSVDCAARVQDLKGKRGFPEDPRLAANQKLQAEVILQLFITQHDLFFPLTLYIHILTE